MAVNKNFVVKHGLEVKQDLLYADAQLERVGIGTTLAYHKLHVNGNAKVEDDLQVVGVTSLGTSTKILTGTLEAGNTGVGTYGQLLISTGAGIAWTTAPNLRKQEIFTAVEGQKQFNFAHTLGYIDVYVNGVKLSTAEYLETSAFVTLLNACSLGDTVELIGYYLYENIGTASTAGINGITVLEENVVTGSPAQVTSINFQGAHVTAAGTGAGVTVTFLGAGVGIASSGTQIGYGFTNLNFIGAGNTFKVNGQTIDISIDVEKIVFPDLYWAKNVTGIHTTSAVGIGSTIPKLDHALDVEGVINTNTYFSNPSTLDKSVVTKSNHNCFASGPYAVETGRILTVGQDSTFSVVGGGGGSGDGVGGGHWIKTSVGIHTYLNVGIGTDTPLDSVSVGNTFVLNVGIVTANYFYGDGRYLRNVGVAVSTSAPSNPVEGNLWWNETLGRGFIYYDAANAWVDFAPGVAGGSGGIGIGGGGGTVIIGSSGFFSDQQINSGIHTTALNVGIGTTNPRFQLEVGPVGAADTSLWVNGNARVTGILTVGSSSIILDGNTNQIKIGSGIVIDENGFGDITHLSVTGVTTLGIVTAGDIYSTGIITATSFSGNADTATYASTAGVSTTATTAGYATTAGIATVAQGLTGTPNIEVGILTATSTIIGSGVTINAGGLNITGVVTASTFIGTFPAGSLVGALPAIDGSLLTGVVAAGTGVIVEDDGTPIGTAGTINFGANLTVSPVSAGVVTVTATGGGAGYFAETLVGIHTLSNVGVGTTNPTSTLTVGGGTSTRELYVTGISTFKGTVNIQSNLNLRDDDEVRLGNDNDFYLRNRTFGAFNHGEIYHVGDSLTIASNYLVLDAVGGTNYLDCTNGAGVNIYYNGNKKFETTSSGVTITGTTSTTALQVGTGGTVINATATAKVGIATTNPVSTLQVERFGVQTGFGTFAASAGITTFIDSFTISSTDFKTAEYTVHLQSASSIQAQKVLVMQNGSTAYSQEWAVMSHPDLLVSIGATVTGGAVRLNVTPEIGVSGIITYRFTRNAML